MCAASQFSGLLPRARSTSDLSSCATVAMWFSVVGFSSVVNVWKKNGFLVHIHHVAAAVIMVFIVNSYPVFLGKFAVE